MEAVGTNFFRQTIAREEFCWVFPHPRLLNNVLNHLDDQSARGVLLLICVPSLLAYFRVFAACKTARFVEAYKEVFPTWQGPEEVASTFFKGKARQRIFSSTSPRSMRSICVKVNMNIYVKFMPG